MVNTSVIHDYVSEGKLIPLVQFTKGALKEDAWDLDPIPSVVDIGYADIAVEPCTVVCARKGADPAGLEAMRTIMLDYLTSEKGIAELREINMGLQPHFR